MPDRLSLMKASELSSVMRGAADGAAAALPDGTLFVLIAFDRVDPFSGDRGIGQYISNCDRSSIVACLREVADRIERGETSERVAFEK